MSDKIKFREAPKEIEVQSVHHSDRNARLYKTLLDMGLVVIPKYEQNNPPELPLEISHFIVSTAFKESLLEL